MGFEHEFAFFAAGKRGGVFDRAVMLERLNAIARETLVHLVGAGESGIFLANSGRLYVDCGEHEEWAGPECTDPSDIVRYILAGEQILVKLAAELVRREEIGHANFYRCNVDYGSRGTWGAHENYLTVNAPRFLAKELIPFLASRIIITGEGGLNPRTEAGCAFTLSPRAMHMEFPISDCSTANRGIIHTKDQTLSSGYRRTHILIGASLCSHKGNWLRAAATSLCVAMADAGIHAELQLCNPINALRTFSADVTCRATARTLAGENLSAIDIQRRFLDLARQNVGQPFMPDWTGQAIAEWDAMLSRLAKGPAAVDRTLDWAMKYRVLTAHIEKRGFDWPALRQCSHLADFIVRCEKARRTSRQGGSDLADAMMDVDGLLADIVRQITPHLAARGMSWQQLYDYAELRLELFALDFKFGQLGSGIFHDLDRAGVLDHGIAGVDRENVDRAITHPPTGGRAKLRGQVIQRLHATKGAHVCNWTSVIDKSKGMILDLNNPFEIEEKWSKMSGAPEEDEPD
jgi:hypothetical protein